MVVHRPPALRLGVSPRMVSAYRDWATKAGILREEEPHSRTDKRATRFVFKLDQFEADGRQRPGSTLHR